MSKTSSPTIIKTVWYQTLTTPENLNTTNLNNILGVLYSDNVLRLVLVFKKFKLFVNFRLYNVKKSISKSVYNIDFKPLLLNNNSINSLNNTNQNLNDSILFNTSRLGLITQLGRNFIVRIFCAN